MKNKIKELIQEKNINILELSKMLGISYKSTYNVVNRDNLSMTRLKVLDAIASILDVKVDDLYD